MNAIIGKDDTKNRLVLTPSLLMRLFEWCHEDAKDDVAMHNAFENIIAFSDGVNPLSMEDYEIIIRDANAGSTDAPDEEEPKYDVETPEGEPQVNGELCNQLENIVASYHEGGIGGNQCYDCIQDAFANNEQTCSEPQISCNDIDTYTDSFCCENCCQNNCNCEDGMTFTIDCNTGSLSDASQPVVAKEELPAGTLEQIKQIVALGGL